ncbi:30S ribosomal protein S4e [Candidatus Altiarchaeota archaeon]
MHVKSITKGIKNKKWAVAPRGPHAESIPLLSIVRDVIGYADNAREAKDIIRKSHISVNGRPEKDHKHGIGFMDVLSIPETKESYRVLTGSKGLYLKDITAKEQNLKLLRVNKKTILSAGRIQLNLHDGTNIITDKKDVKVNDTLLVEIPSLKIKEKVEYAKGNFALIFKGRHGGKTGTITDVVVGTPTRKSLTLIEDIQTLTEYVMVVGKNKPLIAI